MPGKSASESGALDDLKAQLLPVFRDAGYELIAPDILQPADVFLDRSGEDLRSRTYLFVDPDGHELCLRPDLTIPTCRYHLDQYGHAPETEARYCYAGPVFRHQTGAAGARPREYDQAGIEWFGAGDAPEEADAELIRLSIAAVEAVGLTDYRLQLGDIGLFHALLDSIEMPSRWRRRLKQQFWRPKAFRALLDTLTSGFPDAPHAGLDVAALEAVLAERDISHLGNRRLEEISARLQEQAADAASHPLAKEQAGRITRYLDLAGSPWKIMGELSDLADEMEEAFQTAFSAFEARVNALQKGGIAFETTVFAAAFGRTIEYYTGGVFQIEKDGEAVAGGGRYDRLLSDIGAKNPVSAVGCAVHTERLLKVLGGGNG